MKVSDFRLPQSSLAFLSDPGQHQPDLWVSSVKVQVPQLPHLLLKKAVSVDVGGRKGLKPGGSPGKEKPGKPCGKAPRPRKGKMSCFVAEVCGGDEPAVVG